MNRSLVLTCIVALCLSGVCLGAQTLPDEFAKGNQLYREGKYPDAAAAYEGILKQGSVSAEIYYNLGNAYYRAGKIGPSVLAFERAARLRPNDADIVHNLKLAQLKTFDRIDPVPELFLVQWARSAAALVPPNIVILVFVLAWILTFGSLAVMASILHHGVVRMARILWIVVSLAVVCSGILMAIQVSVQSSHDQAIIMVQTVTAKSSPDEHSVDAFVIHEGLKVRLSDSVGEWIKITLADGKVGWILAPQCERI